MAGRRTFEGRTAIITGGASGIGLALGRQLVARGARVVLADVDGTGAERAAAELGATGRALDVTDSAAFGALVGEVVRDHGTLDLLVNNAGICIGGPTHELSAGHWDRIIDVNLRGVVNGVRAAYPQMIEQGHGQIVNTASGAGLVAPPFIVAYAATKHAVVGLSLGLRPEAALHGVRVSALCPGSVDTPILDSAAPADLPPTASAPVTGRAFLAAVGQKPVDVDRFAAQAVRGILRNQPLIVVPKRSRPFWYLHRLSPALTSRVVGLLAKRIDTKLVHPR